MTDTAPVEVDEDAERVLLALLGKPRRLPWSEYVANRWRAPRGTISTDGVSRARGRAASRLIAAHRAEFDRYWVEEQWKIAEGRAK